MRDLERVIYIYIYIYMLLTSLPKPPCPDGLPNQRQPGGSLGLL